uniref:C2 domain-containing protein n=1 Tax=Ascaris lumbricoides TaxID=6252 RepID=A0A9J2PQA3_ASCLU
MVEVHHVPAALTCLLLVGCGEEVNVEKHHRNRGVLASPPSNMDFSSIEAATYGDVENDEELMAELLALEADEKAKATGTRASAPAPPTKQIANQQRAPPAADMRGRPPGGVQLSPQILSEVIKDIPDEDLLTDDDDIDDPELLNELANLVDEESGEVAAAKTPLSQQSTIAVDVAILQRLQQLNTDYTAAVKTANAEGNSAKARRYQRAVDKIQELLKKVQSGKQIDESEIPVAIRGPAAPAVTKLPPPPVPQRPSIASASAVNSNSSNPPAVPPHRVSTSDVNELKDKAAMLEEKSISADNSGAPPVVSREGSHKLNVEQIKSLLRSRREAYVQNAQLANSAGDKTAAYEYYTVAKQFDEAITAVNNGEVTECDESELPPAPVPYRPKKKETVPTTPKTLIEGLQQRLEKYKSMCDQSRQENNDRKYRMNSRIVKQYEEAIRAVRANRSIVITELPCPPGYPPLPTATGTAGGAVTPSAASVARMRQANEVGPLAPVATSIAGQLPQSRQGQQLDFLLKRQLLFKRAALAARKKGDIQTAKKYLIFAKGFDQMIQASRSGLPVDIKKAPIPPQLQTSTEALKPALSEQRSLDVDQIIEGSSEEIFAAMERDLIRQVKLCEENRLAFTKLGDVTRVKLFEQWSSNSKRDLILLRQVAKNGSSVPRFHYETRQFPSVDVCADINEDHLELQIVRVVNAKLPSGWQPSDGNIFVKYEFAFPHESHQSGKTKLVAGTNSPEFNEKVLLSIKRQSKQLLRVVKRNCLKFEVYQKGGFLRSDKLLGTADCKLALLEEKAHIHESVDLMEGRRPAGGKIEFKIRIREPLGEKKLSLQNEKWLILDT